jgi:hypothetical protein
MCMAPTDITIDCLKIQCFDRMWLILQKISHI